MSRPAHELRAFDDELLQAVQEIAAQHGLSAEDVLLRLLSVTALWIHTISNPAVQRREIRASWLALAGDVFDHYAIELGAGRPH